MFVEIFGKNETKGSPYSDNFEELGVNKDVQVRTDPG
jgi:hypothetical protein